MLTWTVISPKFAAKGSSGCSSHLNDVVLVFLALVRPRDLSCRPVHTKLAVPSSSLRAAQSGACSHNTCFNSLIFIHIALSLSQCGGIRDTRPYSLNRPLLESRGAPCQGQRYLVFSRNDNFWFVSYFFQFVSPFLSFNFFSCCFLLLEAAKNYAAAEIVLQAWNGVIFVPSKFYILYSCC